MVNNITVSLVRWKLTIYLIVLRNALFAMFIYILYFLALLLVCLRGAKIISLKSESPQVSNNFVFLLGHNVLYIRDFRV